jgi:hypothetical protein
MIITENAVFADLIDSASHLPEAFDSKKEQLGPTLLEWNNFPLVTLHKLEVLARIQYRAGLSLLHDPSLSHAVQGNVRSLIEYMALAAWITGISQTEDPAQQRRRALCAELGTSRQLYDAIANVPAEYLGSADSNEGARLRLEEIRRFHDEVCRCRGRKSGSVAQTIADLAAIAPHLEKYRYLYDVSSLFLHQQLYDAVLQEIAPGITDYVDASYERRGALLSWLVELYSIGTVQTIGLQSWDRAKELKKSFADVLGHPTLKAALTGELDRAIQAPLIEPT